MSISIFCPSAPQTANAQCVAAVIMPSALALLSDAGFYGPSRRAIMQKVRFATNCSSSLISFSSNACGSVLYNINAPKVENRSLSGKAMPDWNNPTLWDSYNKII